MGVKGPSAQYVHLYAIYKGRRYPAPARIWISACMVGQGERDILVGYCENQAKSHVPRKGRGAQTADQNFEPWSNRG